MFKKLSWLYLIIVNAVFFPHNVSAAIVINEFLAAPPTGIFGDANRDGTRGSTQDEFIELLNTGEFNIDLSSWTLWDRDSPRHLFPQNTFLKALGRLVVFGGGTPAGFLVQTFRATSGGLSLNNTGDQITLKNVSGEAVDSVIYGSEGNTGQSLVRFPEGSGSFLLHAKASSQKLIFSPGTDVEGHTPESIPTVPEPASFGLILSGLLLSLVCFRGLAKDRDPGVLFSLFRQFPGNGAVHRSRKMRQNANLRVSLQQEPDPAFSLWRPRRRVLYQGLVLECYRHNCSRQQRLFR